MLGRVGVVVDRVCATAFVTCGRGHHGGLRAFDEVFHLQGFNARGVEDLGLVFQANVFHTLAQLGDLLHTFVHGGLGAEHTGVFLHAGAQVVGHVLGVFARSGVVQTRQASQASVCRICGQGLVVFVLLMKLDDVVACGFAKHQQVQQGVGAQAVGAVHRHARTFAHGVEAIDHRVVVGGRLGDHLAVDVGGDTAHLVMDGRHHRDGLFGDVHVGKVVANFVNRGQALHDGLGPQVVEFQMHIVFVGAAASAFLDFLVHATGHEVTRCQVFQGGRIALHETLAQAVEQNRAFATAAFGQQHASTGHASGVELPKLHVFQRDARTCGHAQTVAGVDEGVGGGRKNATSATGGHEHGFGFQDVQVASFHFQCSDTDHVALGVTDQVLRHPLHKEVGVGLHVLLVEGVQHGVTCAVGRGASALHRFFAIVGGVTTKGALVNGAVWVAVKGHAHVL